ncbi:uncharacterized protein STEHIDRAFT_151603 [Stereum hirsutum FP-91666 SS1]|uniref:uncharacterized protein n=1 Tax=Stereum hirsutum (strain FP-91666) TaxID=721885 RepID=UPI000440CC2A|nr:uncharacterized protein STEHIDRAFT_151603 [Stereum hirsutum FP-91666 SS1]EIM92266.1 hypothetical protein STEHIDRAFT_151603 [Stereum hirsutum FP-91666 SS1]
MSSTPASSTTTLVTNDVVTNAASGDKIENKASKTPDSETKDRPATATAQASDLSSDTGFAKAAKKQGWASATMYKPSFS